MRSPSARQLLTSVVFVASCVAGLLVASSRSELAPHGALPTPFTILALAIVGAAAAMHRPLAGPGLGLGAVILPIVLASSGAAPAGWAAALTFLVAELARRAFERRSPQAPPERRHRLRVLAGAARCGLAALAAGVFWAVRPGHRPFADLLIAGVAYLLFAALLDRLEGRLRRWEDPIDGRWLLPFLLDAAGWSVGSGLASGPSSPLVSGLVLAALAMLSIEAARNAFHREALTRRIVHLESLGRASQRLGGSGGGQAELAEQIRAEVANVVPFHWFHIELLDGPSSRSFRAGPQGGLEEGLPHPARSPPPLPGIHRRSSWHMIARELVVDGKPVARLRLWCDPRILEAETLELLDLLLPQMAASVERSLLDREARLDALTGLAVRRALEEELQTAHKRACEDGRPVAVILCDLDHFKRINDSYGHDAGDAALVHVAGIFARSGREVDLSCRWGGEEFAILLRETTGAEALGIAERLRQAIASSPVELETGSLSLTVSAGVAAFPELYVRTPLELVTLADAALYAAKGAGRNACLLHLGHGRFRTPEGGLRIDRRSPPN